MEKNPKQPNHSQEKDLYNRADVWMAHYKQCAEKIPPLLKKPKVNPVEKV